MGAVEGKKREILGGAAQGVRRKGELEGSK